MALALALVHSTSISEAKKEMAVALLRLVIPNPSRNLSTASFVLRLSSFVPLLIVLLETFQNMFNQRTGFSNLVMLHETSNPPVPHGML